MYVKCKLTPRSRIPRASHLHLMKDTFICGPTARYKSPVSSNLVEQLLGGGADVDPHALAHLLHHPRNGGRVAHHTVAGSF